MPISKEEFLGLKLGQQIMDMFDEVWRVAEILSSERGTVLISPENIPSTFRWSDEHEGIVDDSDGLFQDFANPKAHVAS